MTAFVTIRHYSDITGVFCRDGTAASFGPDELPMFLCAGVKPDFKLIAANDVGLNLIPFAEFRWSP